MGRTLAEKIIAAHLPDSEGNMTSDGNAKVWPGDLVEVTMDVVLSNDVGGPMAIRDSQKLGVERV